MLNTTQTERGFDYMSCLAADTKERGTLLDISFEKAQYYIELLRKMQS